MFDCNSFINRKGWKQRELAQKLDVGTSTVGMWCTGKSTPPYDVISKLIELGISPVELFGEELASKLEKNSSIAPTEGLSPQMQEMLNHPDFIAGMKKAFDEIESMKKESKSL